jgi:hypothetical protein
VDVAGGSLSNVPRRAHIGRCRQRRQGHWKGISVPPRSTREPVALEDPVPVLAPAPELGVEDHDGDNKNKQHASERGERQRACTKKAMTKLWPRKVDRRSWRPAQSENRGGSLGSSPLGLLLRLLLSFGARALSSWAPPFAFAAFVS